MKQGKLKKQIIEKAWLTESSELARTYFKEIGLEIEKINLEHCEKLKDFISHEMYILLADESYSMVKDLRMSKKIDKNKYGIFLYVNGSYFKKRQAISIEYDKKGDYKFIGFCGWASGCNRIPFIVGFVKWCDWLKEHKE